MFRKIRSILIIFALLNSGFLQSNDNSDHKFTSMTQSKLEIIWSKPFQKKIEYIWSLNEASQLILRTDKDFYLVRTLDGSIIWQKKYKNVNDAFVIKEKNILVIIENSEIILVNTFSRKETSIKVRIKNLEYIDSLDALLVHMGSSNIALINIDNGEIIWRSSFKSKVKDIINYVYDHEKQRFIILAAIGEYEGIISSVNSTDGKINWEKKLIGKIVFPMAVPYPIIKDKYIYLELDGLTKINYETGLYEWHAKYKTLERRDNKRTKILGKYILVNPNAIPIFRGNDIYTAAKGRIRRIDSKTGEIKWKSKDYDLTPNIIVNGDKVFAIAGGIFKRIKERISVLKFLGSIALGVLTASQTGWIMTFTPGVESKDIEDAKEFENINIKDFIKSIIWAGKPRIVSCNKKDGRELAEFPFESKNNYFSGIYIDFPEVILGDRQSIYCFNLKTYSLKTLFRLKDIKIGEQIGFLLKISEDDFLVITSNIGGDLKGYYVAKISLNHGSIWMTPLSEKVEEYKGGLANIKFPVLLAQDSNNLYLIINSKLISLNTRTGHLQWIQELPKTGWSLSLFNESLVYYDKKDKHLNFCKFPKD